MVYCEKCGRQMGLTPRLYGRHYRYEYKCSWCGYSFSEQCHNLKDRKRNGRNKHLEYLRQELSLSCQRGKAEATAEIRQFRRFCRTCPEKVSREQIAAETPFRWEIFQTSPRFLNQYQEYIPKV